VAQQSLSIAVEQFGADRVEVNWLPYMIDPQTDPKGEEYLAYNRRRWGGDGWTASLRQRGAAVGAAFSDWRWWPNTLNAHRLVHFAQAKGLSSSAAKAAIFEALYEEGINVSGPEALADVAARKLGLDRSEVLRHLESDEGVAEVIKVAQEGAGIVQGGVPFFLVSKGDGDAAQRPIGFSGAQDTRTFLDIFRQVVGE